MGLVKKSGSWFYYNENRIAQGRDNARLYLKENKDIYEEIKEKILEEYGLGEKGKKAAEAKAKAEAKAEAKEDKAPKE